MECAHFEELIGDYLDCGLARPVRRSFCEHLLACSPCHLLFNDVREVIDACHQLKESPMREMDLFTEFTQRIINATTAGEMLSCRTLDALISDYFEGLIESSYENIFTEHFAACESCRRLVEGVRKSIEEKETVDVPEQLNDRIIAATVGARR
jgi:predicted anti-sigma-YlaC factor YlaD